MLFFADQIRGDAALLPDFESSIFSPTSSARRNPHPIRTTESPCLVYLGGRPTANAYDNAGGIAIASNPVSEPQALRIRVGGYARMNTSG
jgi:hypothetical protein